MHEKTAARGRAGSTRGGRQADLDRLREGLRRLAADDLDFRVEAEGNGPEAMLARELNGMAERLKLRREEVVRAVELYCLRRFGTVLVHDLKNLAARLTFTHENLRDGPDDREVVEACAGTVKDTADRLVSLVRRFQDQRDAMVLKIRGDVNQAVRGAVEHSGVAETPGIEMELELEEIPRTQVDLSYLQEAFVNILRNAAEAMSGRGKLSIRSRLAEGEGAGPQAEITIADDGPGMTDEFIRQELFAPFRTTKPNGMGLGMFSCKETIELHGGRIRADSTPGSGTTFRILIPVIDEGGGGK